METVGRKELREQLGIVRDPQSAAQDPHQGSAPPLVAAAPPTARVSSMATHAPLPVESRDDILDLATTLALCGDDTTRAEKYPDRIGEFHRVSIHRTGHAQRERDRAALESIDRDLTDRKALLASIPAEVARLKD